MKIKEVIVVEGKDDERAIKQAVEAEVIITNGFGIKEEVFKRIELASKKKGVIIFTDPDYAGKQIRKRINNRIKGCKNAFITQKDACKNNNIGIENATPQSIIDSLKKAKCIMENPLLLFTSKDLFENNLIGGSQASKRRLEIGKLLGIGYANAKQFISRLNNYGITKEEFYNSINSLDPLERK